MTAPVLLLTAFLQRHLQAISLAGAGR
jgi:hypothetical protein